MKYRCLALFLVAFIFLSPVANAEDFYCEVLGVEGSATLTRSSDAPKAIEEGDILQVDDAIEVAEGGYVDISYDKDWSNVTRVEEKSKIVIKAIYPTTIDLEEGGVYAKLKALPKDSTFEVKTPTAIASVRGTEYRTTVISGETEIYNLSESNVYVYGFDQAGTRQAEPVVLANSQKTHVVQKGHPPVAPRAMEQRDFKPAEMLRQGVERKIQDNVSRGRVGKIQDVKAVEQFHQKQHLEGRQGESNKVFTDKDIQSGRSEALRSDGPSDGSRAKREPLEPMSADAARDRVQQMTGSGHGASDREGIGQAPEESRSTNANKFNEGRSVFAGERSHEGSDRSERGESFEGRGLGQPYFPSDEHSRSGGPEPAGFPSDRWKSGFEDKGKEASVGQNFDANRERHEPMGSDGSGGPGRVHDGGQQNQHNRQGGSGQENRQGGGQKQGGGQNRGGAGRPSGPRK